MCQRHCQRPSSDKVQRYHELSKELAENKKQRHDALRRGDIELHKKLEEKGLLILQEQAAIGHPPWQGDGI